MRILYSAISPCRAGCKYCFAKWNDIYPGQPRLDEINQETGEKQAIIYPCCDGEFFDQHNLVSLVEEYAQSMEKVYVSISTKQRLEEKSLYELVQLNNNLTATNKGFVKFSISLSCKTMLTEIEPGTMSYSERLDLAKCVCETGIPNSLTLKPILPFIPEDEYFEIIDDFSSYLRHILVGGLYVNRDSEFFLKHIKGKWDASPRTVGWIAGAPKWDYVADESKMSAICSFSRSRNMHVFDSDVDLIKSYINK